MYSEKRARDIFFGTIESVLATTGASRLILCGLTREAAIRGHQNAVAVGYEFSNWGVAANAVIRAMLSAGVLLTYGGSPVPIGIAAQATTVVGLKDGYQDLTEAYLVEFLIRKLGDVTTRDHRAVAHALFRQFDPTISMDHFEDRVAMLAATLADRIVLNEVGAYTVRNEVQLSRSITL